MCGGALGLSVLTRRRREQTVLRLGGQPAVCVGTLAPRNQAKVGANDRRDGDQHDEYCETEDKTGLIRYL